MLPDRLVSVFAVCRIGKQTPFIMGSAIFDEGTNGLVDLVRVGTVRSPDVGNNHAFFSFHTFRGVMRYSSFVDLSRIAYSNIAAGVFVCLVHQVEAKCGHSAFYMTPRFETAIFIYALATMIMWGLRVIVKTLHDSYRGDDSVQKVFIYGCMQGGIALAKSIRNQNPLRFRLRGFISGDKTLDGSWLLGEKVHYDEDSVVELMTRLKVTTLLVSPLQTERFTNRPTLIDALIKANIKIMMMPQSEE